MSCQLVYTKRAVKDIRRLNDETKQRVKTALEKHKENPIQFAQKLSNPDLGSYRYRVGDYRVIFDIDEENIIILRIGHRKEIYRTS